MKTLKECLIWIENKGLAQKFISNYENQKTKPLEDFLMDSLIPNFLRSLIGNAFIWAKTPEGGDFWSRINSEFHAWFDE